MTARDYFSNMRRIDVGHKLITQIQRLNSVLHLLPSHQRSVAYLFLPSSHVNEYKTHKPKYFSQSHPR